MFSNLACQDANTFKFYCDSIKHSVKALIHAKVKALGKDKLLSFVMNLTSCNKINSASVQGQGIILYFINFICEKMIDKGNKSHAH